MQTSTFNRIYKTAQQVNLESNDWFNYAGFFWVNLSDRQLQKMQQLLKAQGCKTVEKNGEEWFSLNSGILIKTHRTTEGFTMKRVTFTYDSKDMKHGINGEIGEACASILLDDDRAEEIRAAFNENRKVAAAYIMRERAIGFCWSCEHLRGRGFIEGSIKSVQVEDI